MRASISSLSPTKKKTKLSSKKNEGNPKFLGFLMRAALQLRIASDDTEVVVSFFFDLAYKLGSWELGPMASHLG